jgi:Xaa-Pro aminopeptidase
MASDYRAARQAALRRRLETLGLDAMLVGHLPNIRYLTGYTGSAGQLVVHRARTLLITDTRYAVQAPQETGDLAEVVVEGTNLWNRVRETVGLAGPVRFGFERDRITVRDAERLAGIDHADPVPTASLVEELRMVKDPCEVALIGEAAALAHAALGEVLPEIRAGDTEILVAARLESALRRRGSEWHPFQTIVASGPRSALPHARAGSRTLTRGDWLLIDFGAQVGGYSADITRTFVLGRADARQREVYGVVEAAQRRAREQMLPGMSGKQADALARDVVAERGFGAAFGHSLGHGLGLEVHEGPRLAVTAEELLPAGAVVTVEPGIYLEGWGGVRLEDDIHLLPEGPRCLTDGRTELVELL